MSVSRSPTACGGNGRWNGPAGVVCTGTPEPSSFMGSAYEPGSPADAAGDAKGPEAIRETTREGFPCQTRDERIRI